MRKFYTRDGRRFQLVDGATDLEREMLVLLTELSMAVFHHDGPELNHKASLGGQLSIRNKRIRELLGKACQETGWTCPR